MMTAKDRQRRCRERKRHGKRIVPVEVDFDDCDALVDAGLLQFEDSENRKRISDALRKLLNDVRDRHA